jgi:hypothetical protein
VIDTDIATHIRNQIAELDAEREALTAALVALDNHGVAGADSKPARRRRPSRGVAGEIAAPAAKIVPLGKILQLLTDSDGQTTSALAKATGGDQRRILELLKEAESDDKVKRRGQRRATRWHLVTEESRIAERVPELEAGPDPEAAAKRRAVRRKAGANRKVKAAKAAAETTDNRAPAAG